MAPKEFRLAGRVYNPLETFRAYRRYKLSDPYSDPLAISDFSAVG